MKRGSIVDKLERIRTPTLVMCGREDLATPAEHAETIAKNIPGARLVMLDGVGHMSALEAPEAVNEHLVPFVKSLVTSS